MRVITIFIVIALTTPSNRLLAGEIISYEHDANDGKPTEIGALPTDSTKRNDDYLAPQPTETGAASSQFDTTTNEPSAFARPDPAPFVSIRPSYYDGKNSQRYPPPQFTKCPKCQLILTVFTNSISRELIYALGSAAQRLENTHSKTVIHSYLVKGKGPFKTQSMGNVPWPKGLEFHLDIDGKKAAEHGVTLLPAVHVRTPHQSMIVNINELETALNQLLL